MGLRSLTLLISIICFSAITQSQTGVFIDANPGEGTSDCSYVRLYTTSISQSYLSYDVSMEIDKLKASMSNCGISSRNLGVPEGFFDQIKLESQREAFNKVKTDIEKYSETGKVDQFKEEYDTYAKLLKATDHQKFWDEHKTLGEKNYKKERKSCTPVDMSKEMGPVRNQDSIGWCYAFTTADLLSYKLKKQISAADVANTYNQGVLTGIRKAFGATADKFEGGFIDNSLEDAMKKGLCLEKNLPSEDNIFSDYGDMLSTFDDMGRRAVSNPESANCAAMSTSPLTKKFFPNLSVNDFKELIETSSKTNFVDKAIDKTCKDRIPANFEVENISSLITNDMGDKVDAVLSQKIPVGIGYDAGVLLDRRNPSKGFWHGSSLVGRRFNEKSGQCEYLLRNSWGRSCDSYDKTFKCKNGNIWLPKRDVLRSLRSATYVK